ncbi:MAG: 50S ribosomal protein L3 [Planctomycetota bacterium]
MIGILGKKLGMTQIFEADGTCVPVTVVEAGPCKVLQVKVADVAELPDEQRNASTNLGKKRGKQARPRRADGYYAVQLGFGTKTDKAANQAESGHAAKAEAKPSLFVRELRYDTLPPYKQGDEIRVDILKDVKRVDIIGTTKGRGFAGTIKRWNFARQSASHGNSVNHRRAGGIGRQYSTHHGVPKNKKMSGHYGVQRRTVQNLEVVKVDEERNLVFIRGAIPGHRQANVLLRKSVKV